MLTQKIIEQIVTHIDAVIAQTESFAVSLWRELLRLHPADIALLFETLEHEKAVIVFSRLPLPIKLEVFQDLHHPIKVRLLESLGEEDRNYIITNLSIDDLTDFFDDLSDEELQKYLTLLKKHDQTRVLSLLRFAPESAGGIMNTEVMTLMQDFTVEKSIQILQRLQPSSDLHRQIYVVSQDNELVGHINLEDLVLQNPKTPLRAILRPNIVTAFMNDDREVVAQKMVHYSVSSIPVLNETNMFLGVIPSEAVAQIVEEEAGEDIYKMSALSPIKYTYFETPFFRLLYQRSFILIVLLLLQTFSTLILERYEPILCGFLIYFISMLTSTGGNASSQTSALAIQGMATGEINESNQRRFIVREFIMALFIAGLLAVFAFARIYFTHHNGIGGFAVSASLFMIVLVSIMLGCCMPLLLKRFNVDPAHSAGPVLTTIMDVVGLLIFCSVSSLIFYLVR